MSTWVTGLLKHEAPLAQCPKCGAPHVTEGVTCNAQIKACGTCGYIQSEEGDCQHCQDGTVTSQRCAGITESINLLSAY